MAYPETDAALDGLSSWPVNKGNSQKEFQSREKYMNHINKHRYELDSKNVSVQDEIRFYSQDIEVFIQWMYDAVSDVNTGSVWKSLVGYQELIMASEHIGRERGYGIYFFAVGYFKDRDHYLLFIESQETGKTFFESARQYSVVAYETFQRNLENKNETLQEILKLRNEVRSNKSSQQDGSLEAAKWWFSNMSIYRDVMRETQQSLTAKINKLLEQNLYQDLMDMLISGAIVLGILLVSPLICLSAYILTSNIQKYSLSIAKKTKALNKEKKQSEAILYQMLPKSVAESLKRNQTVKAEQFDDCTFFQSDMVGFTRLSASSFPLEVTEMLNCVFSCFDTRIELYDVYKVETIGDGYVVASGVPRKNGRRHASEICTMSLDLLYHMSKLELPHSPGDRYTIRTGCHSANRIQISETTNRILEKIGGFNVEPREINDIDVHRELVSLGLSHKTYWLLSKDNLDWGLSSMSSLSEL